MWLVTQWRLVRKDRSPYNWDLIKRYSAHPPDTRCVGGAPPWPRVRSYLVSVPYPDVMNLDLAFLRLRSRTRDLLPDSTHQHHIKISSQDPPKSGKDKRFRDSMANSQFVCRFYRQLIRQADWRVSAHAAHCVLIGADVIPSLGSSMFICLQSSTCTSLTVSCVYLSSATPRGSSGKTFSLCPLPPPLCPDLVHQPHPLPMLTLHPSPLSLPQLPPSPCHHLCTGNTAGKDEGPARRALAPLLPLPPPPHLPRQYGLHRYGARSSAGPKRRGALWTSRDCGTESTSAERWGHPSKSEGHTDRSDDGQ